MKEQTYWSHYKLDSKRKDRLIFFTIGWFYKTFDTDAEVCSLLLGFQVSMQNGSKVVWFPMNSWDKYFSLLKQADYSFVVLQLQESGPTVIQYHLWSKALSISVPAETYVSLLNDMKNLVQKYETIMRIISPINLEIWGEYTWNNSTFLPPELPEDKENNLKNKIPQNPIL